MNGDHVRHVSNCVYLGAMLDYGLRFAEHVDNVYKHV